MKYRVSLNGKDYEIEVERGEAQILNISDTPVAAAPAAPAAAPVAAAPAAPAAPVAAGAGDPVVSPMPGTIVKVNVAQGDAVKKGQVLLVLEAMKMENEIVAPRDGTVGTIVTSKGASVNTDDLLLKLL